MLRFVVDGLNNKYNFKFKFEQKQSEFLLFEEVGGGIYQMSLPKCISYVHHCI